MKSKLFALLLVMMLSLQAHAFQDPTNFAGLYRTTPYLSDWSSGFLLSKNHDEAALYLGLAAFGGNATNVTFVDSPTVGFTIVDGANQAYLIPGSYATPNDLTASLASLKAANNTFTGGTNTFTGRVKIGRLESDIGMINSDGGGNLTTRTLATAGGFSADVVGNVIGTTFFGDGSHLTGVQVSPGAGIVTNNGIISVDGTVVTNLPAAYVYQGTNIYCRGVWYHPTNSTTAGIQEAMNLLPTSPNKHSQGGGKVMLGPGVFYIQGPIVPNTLTNPFQLSIEGTGWKSTCIVGTASNEMFTIGIPSGYGSLTFKMKDLAIAGNVNICTNMVHLNAYAYPGVFTGGGLDSATFDHVWFGCWLAMTNSSVVFSPSIGADPFVGFKRNLMPLFADCMYDENIIVNNCAFTYVNGPSLAFDHGAVMNNEFEFCGIDPSNSTTNDWPVSSPWSIGADCYFLNPTGPYQNGNVEIKIDGNYHVRGKAAYFSEILSSGLPRNLISYNDGFETTGALFVSSKGSAWTFVNPNNYTNATSGNKPIPSFVVTNTANYPTAFKMNATNWTGTNVVNLNDARRGTNSGSMSYGGDLIVGGNIFFSGGMTGTFTGAGAFTGFTGTNLDLYGATTNNGDLQVKGVISGNGIGLTNLINGTTLSAGANVTLTLTTNAPIGSRNYQVDASGGGTKSPIYYQFLTAAAGFSFPATSTNITTIVGSQALSTLSAGNVRNRYFRTPCAGTFRYGNLIYSTHAGTTIATGTNIIIYIGTNVITGAPLINTNYSLLFASDGTATDTTSSGSLFCPSNTAIVPIFINTNSALVVDINGWFEFDPQ